MDTKAEDKRLRKKWRSQRARKGFSDSDVWGIDYWFSDTIARMLTELRDHTDGHPVFDDEGNFAAPDESYDNDERDRKLWYEILSRMIFLAKEMNDETCSMVNPYMDEYVKHETDLWESHKTMNSSDSADEPEEIKKLKENFLKFELEKKKYIMSCKDEFFELFSKYYFGLWA